MSEGTSSRSRNSDKPKEIIIPPFQVGTPCPPSWLDLNGNSLADIIGSSNENAG